MVTIIKKYKKQFIISLILIIISFTLFVLNKHNIKELFQEKNYINTTGEPIYSLYYKNIKINCSGTFYYLKKNKEIDSVYLVNFNFTGNGSSLTSNLVLNISYYGLNIKENYNKPEILIFIFETLEILSRAKFVNVKYSKNGDIEKYKINLYENKKEYKKILYELSQTNCCFKDYIKDLFNYEISKNSYIFIKLENKQLKYIEGYINSINKEKNKQIILFFKCDVNYTTNITQLLFKQYFLSQ